MGPLTYDELIEQLDEMTVQGNAALTFKDDEGFTYEVEAIVKDNETGNVSLIITQEV